jgi:hypothetical protein
MKIGIARNAHTGGENRVRKRSGSGVGSGFFLALSSFAFFVGATCRVTDVGVGFLFTFAVVASLICSTCGAASVGIGLVTTTNELEGSKTNEESEKNSGQYTRHFHFNTPTITFVSYS